MCNVKKKILAGNAVIGRMSEEDGGQTETGEAKVFFLNFFFALMFFFVSILIFSLLQFSSSYIRNQDRQTT